MQKLTGMEWLKSQLRKIVSSFNTRYAEKIKKIENVEAEISNEFQTWTPLKLIFLHYVMAIYTAIASKHFRHIFYVDLFAGSGINKIKKDILIGSPFIATLNHHKKYDKFFFVEKDKEYAKALKKRLECISIENQEVINDDCNNAVGKILEEIDKANNKHSLFFIDPYAMEINWETMKKILEIRSDIIFTFMSSQIIRAWAAAKSNKEYEQKRLNAFFGDDSWKKANDIDELLGIYKENILKIRTDAVIEDVHINPESGFNYHIIFITTKTRGENQWMGGIKKAKTEIEKNPSGAVKIALEIIGERQQDLSAFSQQ